MENYKCSSCGKENVKLWRPKNTNSPLLCKQCLEKAERYVPAIMDENGDFWPGESIPSKVYRNWNKLPEE